MARRLNSTSKDIRQIAELLYHYDCGVCTPGNEDLFQAIGRLLPLDIRRYPSGSNFNGWVIPDSWRVKKAEIRLGEKLLFDGTAHPLAVAALSKSFVGNLKWEELKQHIHTRPDVPEAHGYHCMWQYRPWARDWCFSVPHDEFTKWPKHGEYTVELSTDSLPGNMLVGICDIAGERPETIIVNAHTCHPRQANDDIAGVAVAIDLFRWLANRKNTFSYRLVLGPEHLGTVFYLSSLSRDQIRKMVGGYFLEMPGTRHPLKVASSFKGNTWFDAAIRHAALLEEDNCEFVGWRCGAGNDETVWEAPGYEVPFVEVSRCNETFSPFREYHTSEDTIENVDWGNVYQFSSIIRHTIGILDQDRVMRRKFDGLICLSNPEYNLYWERPDPAIQKHLSRDSEKWGTLLDSLPRYFDGSISVLGIAERHGLQFNNLLEYLKRFERKNLITFEPAIP